MSHSTIPISIIVHTKNSAVTLQACLESAKFAEEIIVIDMHSNDETKKIAERYTDHFFLVEDSGYVETVRNFGISKATQEWVFLLDADEELSDGLKTWLESYLSDSSNAQKANAYWIPRKNFFFKQEIQHTGWWPDYQLRFFRKGSVNWKEEIHSQPEVKGKVERLPAKAENALIHQNYRSVEQYIARMNHYTSIAAKETKLKNTVTPADLASTFSNEFIQRFSKWEGFKDGGIGLSLSLFQASYQLLVKMKQWEYMKFEGKNAQEAETVAAIEKFQRELRYWVSDWHVSHSSGLMKIFWQLRRKLSS